MLKKIVTLLLAGALVFTVVSCASRAEVTDVQNVSLEQMETLQLQGAGGMIPVVIQKPEMLAGEKYPVAVVMHGFMASKEYHLVTNIADKLQEAGFVVVRFDFNGHGEGYGDFQDMTVPSELDDALAVVDYVQDQPYTKSINLVGHSQGGVVTSLVAGELGDAVNSIVLFAPAAVLEDQLNEGMVMGVPFDRENLPEYVEVFGHRVGKNYIIEGRNLHIYDRASAYKGPACIIHGKADFVVPFSYGERYHEIYAGSELHLLEGEDHEFKADTDSATDLGVAFLVKEAL